MKLYNLTKEIKPEFLKATAVSRELGITSQTLTNWYKWAAMIKRWPKDIPPLPIVSVKKVNGTRYWKPEDIDKLKKFKDSIPTGNKGFMAEYNKKFWTRYK